MNTRHLKIIDIIKNEDISTQEELVKKLQENKIKITQSTVSRDIKKLGLVKVPAKNGGYNYALSNKANKTRYNYSNDWLEKMINDFVVNASYSGNLIVLKTLPGSAEGLGAAIDNINWDGIIGTVAGNNTLIVVVKPKKKTQKIYRKMVKIIGLDLKID